MRRVVLVLAVAAVCSGVGSALFASPALAGGVNTENGYLSGALYNVTPYTLREVAEGSPVSCIVPGYQNIPNCWQLQHPAAVIAPGASTGFTLASNLLQEPVLGNGYRTEIGYDAWITYRSTYSGVRRST
jgi:hypothetical protein